MLPTKPSLRDFTQNQLKVYNHSFTRLAKRMLITWEPWTWKSTLMGLSVSDYEREARSEGKQADVVNIAYNVNLVAFNRQLWNIDSKTYLSTLQARTKFLWDIADSTAWSNFYKLSLAAQNEKIRKADCPSYWSSSYLCIDEGQDIHPAAYEKFSEMFENIYVFMDDGQTLGQREESVNTADVSRILGIKMTDKHHLTENFRNTKEIHDAFHCLRQADTGEDTVAATRHGTKPIRYFLSPDGQLEQIATLCKTTPTNQNICIVASTIEEQDVIESYLIQSGVSGIQTCYKQHPIVYLQHSVFILNTSNIKGLEFHKVVLFDVSDAWLKKKNSVYVSATRASDELHVFFRNEDVFHTLWLKEASFRSSSKDIETGEFEF